MEEVEGEEVRGRGEGGKEKEGEERKENVRRRREGVQHCSRPTLVQGEELLLSRPQSQTQHQTPLHIENML